MIFSSSNNNLYIRFYALEMYVSPIRLFSGKKIDYLEGDIGI